MRYSVERPARTKANAIEVILEPGDAVTVTNDDIVTQRVTVYREQVESGGVRYPSAKRWPAEGGFPGEEP